MKKQKHYVSSIRVSVSWIPDQANSTLAPVSIAQLLGLG
jgi:hypothetical protein